MTTLMTLKILVKIVAMMQIERMRRRSIIVRVTMTVTMNRRKKRKRKRRVIVKLWMRKS